MTTEATFTAGDTYSARVELPEYPAGAGWVLKHRLVPRAGGAAILLSAAADGDAHVLSAAAAITAAWVRGDYAVARWVERAGESFVVEQGQIAILPDPRTMIGGTDTRSQAEIALADAEAAFAAWTPTHRRYRIGDREREFSSQSEIIAVINYWAAKVKREEADKAIAAGRPNPRKLHVHMGRA